MPAASTAQTKLCQTCGRTITWRKKWQRDWQQVRYCSDACRRQKPGPQAAALEAAILQLLQQRGAGNTICPSEAARLVAAQAAASPLAEQEEAAWRALMEPARQAARRLVAAGKILITQGGTPVDPSRAKGPIRLRQR